VNDVNKSLNYVKVLSLKDCTFVSELLYVTNNIDGIAIRFCIHKIPFFK